VNVFVIVFVVFLFVLPLLTSVVEDRPSLRVNPRDGSGHPYHV